MFPLGQRPSVPQPPPPSEPPTPEERVRQGLERLAFIKGELPQATYPSIVRDRLKDVIEVIEWMFTGRVSSQQYHHVPGTPASQEQLNPSGQRVEFVYHGQPPQQAQGPVRNGDTQFTPGGATIGNPQDVQLGTPHTMPSGQRVEYFPSPGASPGMDPTAPVSNQPHQIVPGRPPVTVEAGQHIPDLAQPQPQNGGFPIPLLK